MQIDKDYLYKDQSYFGHVRKELLPFIPCNLSTILDVGCSNGDFAHLLKKQQQISDVWGIEPFPTACALAKEKLDTVICSNIETAIESLPKAYFDCVFFNDVLEHLVNPTNVLSNITQNIKQGGYVFASIPNIVHFDTLYSIIRTLDWKYENSGILDKTHLRFFTKKSIIRMFKEAGYSIVSINGINPSYSMRFKFINQILLNKLDEMKFIQFAVLAKSNR